MVETDLADSDESYLDNQANAPPAYNMHAIRHKNSIITTAQSSQRHGAIMKDSSLDSSNRRVTAPGLNNLNSKNTSFKDCYDSINYITSFGHDIEVMHSIQVKHIRQIKTIEDARRYSQIEKRFNSNSREDESLTVIPIDREIDIVF